MIDGREQGTKRNNKKSAEEIAAERGLELKKNCSRYTNEQKQFFIQYVPGHTYAEIQDEFANRFHMYITMNQIKGYIANHKLNTGLDGRFPKGHIPFNKGSHYYGKGCEKGWFRKGNTPPNHKEIGSERITRDGYVEIKVAEPNKWKLKHRVIWEQANGPIPEGMIICFKDGDGTNVKLDNLFLSSRTAHVRFNQYYSDKSVHPELKETAYVCSELVGKANKAQENFDKRRKNNGRKNLRVNERTS